MMKKCIKRLIFVVFLMIGMVLITHNVKATSVNLNCTNDVNISSNSKKVKIKPGEEIWISIGISDENDEKIMALYGNIEYDKNVLELVKTSDESTTEETTNNAEIKVGENWTIGNVTESSTEDDSNLGNAKILLYTTNNDKSDTGLYIKFKVKDDVKEQTTEIALKDLVLYNEQYKESSEKIDDVTLSLKISKANVAVVIVTLIVVFIILAIAICVLKKNKSNEKSKISNEKVDQIENTTKKDNIDDKNIKNEEKI